MCIITYGKEREKYVVNTKYEKRKVFENLFLKEVRLIINVNQEFKFVLLKISLLNTNIKHTHVLTCIKCKY